MRVREVTAIIRLSTEVSGSWRTLELGAVGIIDINEEDWKVAQRDLYSELRTQFADLWAKGERSKREAVADQKLPFDDEEEEEPQRQSDGRRDQPSNTPQIGSDNRQGGQGSGNQSGQQGSHYCNEHGMDRKVRENSGSGVAFWSHKIPDNQGGGWCNQAADGTVQVINNANR